MDTSQLKESPSQLEKNKKMEDPEEFYSPFKVIREVANLKEQTFSLKLVKPNLQSKLDARTISYPVVHYKEERANNQHAFFIMHTLCHKHILSMKVLCKDKVHNSDPSSLAAFVEPYTGLLWSICGLDECADNVKHIPSSKFQNFVRGIVIGLDFLRKNGLYHGNLTWDSTLYHGETVKLAGFTAKDSMSKVEAQWNDWLCFLKMLERVSERAVRSNQSSFEIKYSCANLDLLINMLKTLDMKSLPVIKETILEHPFFWDLAKRINFFASTISLKLSDYNFMEAVSNLSICEKPWDKKGTLNFLKLVKTMNDHRKAKMAKAYDGDSLEDYIRCVCGAYTHWRQMKVDADVIIRENHPTICIDMKHIIEVSNSLFSGSKPSS